MGLGTNQMTNTTHDVFIPEIWRDEVIVAREANLVAAKLFRTINHRGKPGDNIHLPNVAAISANAKTANTEVTLNANTEVKTTIALDKHYESSFLVEDITKVQNAYQLRSLYTSRAGYALAKQIDDDILALYASVSTSAPDHAIDGSGSDYALGAGTGTAITKAGFLQAIELLDVADVPSSGRFAIIPPQAKKDLLSLADFTYVQNIGRPTEIQKGKFGSIFGIDIYVTSNMPNDNTSYPVCIIGHPDGIACAMQQDVRVQGQYKQQYLGTLVTADVIYGVKVLRDDHFVAMMVA